MTFKEKWMKEHPNAVFEYFNGCPFSNGYEDKSVAISADGVCLYTDISCKQCWDREIPEEKPVFKYQGEPIAKVTGVTEENGGVTVNAEPIIKDSGDRTQFESGAVRDMREGKGRCDLMPLEVVRVLTRDLMFSELSMFQASNDVNCLYRALDLFSRYYDDGKTKASVKEMETQRCCSMLLEVAKHYEEGAKKYGENNWQKGIPTWCYIDSAIRHYLKWLRGDTDEPHDRAFVWNLMCCIWEADRTKTNKEE